MSADHRLRQVLVGSAKLDSSERESFLQPSSLIARDAVVEASEGELRAKQKRDLEKRLLTRVRQVIVHLFNLIQSEEHARENSDDSRDRDLSGIIDVSMDERSRSMQLCEWIALCNIVLSVHCESSEMSVFDVILDVLINRAALGRLSEIIDDSEHRTCELNRLESLVSSLRLQIYQSSPLHSSLVPAMRDTDTVAILNDFIRAFGFSHTSDSQSLFEILDHMREQKVVNEGNSDNEMDDNDADSKELSDEDSEGEGETTTTMDSSSHRTSDFDQRQWFRMKGTTLCSQISSAIRHYQTDSMFINQCTLEPNPGLKTFLSVLLECCLKMSNALWIQSAIDSNRKKISMAKKTADQEGIEEKQSEVMLSRHFSNSADSDSADEKRGETMMGMVFEKKVDDSEFENGEKYEKYRDIGKDLYRSMMVYTESRDRSHLPEFAVGWHSKLSEALDKQQQLSEIGKSKDSCIKGDLKCEPFDLIHVHHKEEAEHSEVEYIDLECQISRIIDDYTSMKILSVSLRFCTPFSGVFFGSRDHGEISEQSDQPHNGSVFVDFNLDDSFELWKRIHKYHLSTLRSLLRYIVTLFHSVMVPFQLDCYEKMLSFVRSLTLEFIHEASEIKRIPLLHAESAVQKALLGKYKVSLPKRPSLKSWFELTKCSNMKALRDTEDLILGDLRNRMDAAVKMDISRVCEKTYRLSKVTGTKKKKSRRKGKKSKSNYVECGSINYTLKRQQFVVNGRILRRFKRYNQKLLCYAEKYESNVAPKIDRPSDKPCWCPDTRGIQCKASKHDLTRNELPSCLPCLNYHCTSSKNLSSIFDEGLMMAGDWISSIGEIIPVAHGRVWGSGVYTTPDLSLALHYSEPDLFSQSQSVVCLVNPGKIHFLGSDQDCKYAHRCLESAPSMHIIINDDDDGEEGEVKGTKKKRRRVVWRYACGANSHLSPDGRQLVCAHSSQVCPISLVTVTPKHSILGGEGITLSTLEMKDYVKTLSTAYYFDDQHSWISKLWKSPQIIYSTLSKVGQLHVKNEFSGGSGGGGRTRNILESSNVRMSALCNLGVSTNDDDDDQHSSLHDSIWAAIIDGDLLGSSLVKRSEITLHLLIDTSDVMTISHTYSNRVIPLCADLMRDVQPTHTHAYLFGDEIKRHMNVKSPHFFRDDNPLICGSDRSGTKTGGKGRRFLDALKLCFESILDKHEKMMNDIKLDAFDAAEQMLYSQIKDDGVSSLEELNGDREIRTVKQLCRAIVKSCAKKACDIADLRYQASFVKTPTVESSKISAKVRILQKDAKQIEDLSQRVTKTMHMIVIFISGKDTSSFSSSSTTTTTTTNTVKMAEWIEHYQRMFQVKKKKKNSMFQMIIKPVLIGGMATDIEGSSQLARIKEAMQTVQSYERYPLYCAHPRRVLGTLGKKLRTELTQLSLGSAVRITVSPAERILGEGFMIGPLKQTEWDVQVAANASQCGGGSQSNYFGRFRRMNGVQPIVVFYRGKPPRHISVNGLQYPVVIDNDDSGDGGGHSGGHSSSDPRRMTADMRNAVLLAPSITRSGLKVIQSFITDLRVKATDSASNKDRISGALKVISTMVSALKTHSSNPSALARLDANDRVRQMQSVKSIICDIESILSEIRFAHQLNLARQTSLFGEDVSLSSALGAPKIAWLRNIKDMKYGKRALKRVSRIDGSRLLIKPKTLLFELSEMHASFVRNSEEIVNEEMDEMEMMMMMSEEEGKPSSLKNEGWMWKSSLNQKSMYECYYDTLKSVDSLLMTDDMNHHHTLVDCLYSLGILGICVRIERSAAAMVDPWQIKVSFVGHCYLDSASCMCALDSGLGIAENIQTHKVRYFDENQSEELLGDSDVIHNSISDAALASSKKTKKDHSKGTTSSISSISISSSKKKSSLSIVYQRVTDVCALLDRTKQKTMPEWNANQLKFLKSKLNRVYMAAVFTRNPSLHIGSQRTALLVSVFCRSITQLFMKKWRKYKKHPDSQAAQNAEMQARSEIETALNAAFTLSQTLSNQARMEWLSTLDKMKNSELRPGVYMTASDEDRVSSVCKLLAALVVFRNESNVLFNEHFMISRDYRLDESMKKIKISQCQLSRVAIAMIAECSAREAKIYLRNDRDRMWKSLKNAFGIKDDSIPDQSIHRNHTIEYLFEHRNECIKHYYVSEYNVEKLKKHSGRFFFEYANRTNCSPWTIVACLGFARALFDHQKMIEMQRKNDRLMAVFNDDSIVMDDEMDDGGKKKTEDEKNDEHDGLVDFILNRFRNRQVSMSNFIIDFLPTSDGWTVQCGLYAQSLRYFKSSARREGQGLPELTEPESIIKDIASNIRQYILQRKFAIYAMKLRQDSKVSKKEYQSVQQRLFGDAHFPPNIPKIFTHAQISKMNEERPKCDQLELMDSSGLLKHHCCFPKCPMFLHNCSTENDAILDTRNGLYKHLKYYWVPRPIGYVRGLHSSINAFLLRRQSQSQSHSSSSLIGSHSDQLVLRTPEERIALVEQWKQHFKHTRPESLDYQTLELIEKWADDFVFSFPALKQ